MFSEARAQAKALDAEFASTGRLRGPLHGVPVSFKDVCEHTATVPLSSSVLTARTPRLFFPVDVQGYDTTMGFSSRAHQPSFEDAKVGPQLSFYRSERCSGHTLRHFLSADYTSPTIDE